ncbi:MAG: VTT domain-containing protein [Gemmatimonadota bacterium]|nr:MAG: VTT domain-containing protein [Gemmatimonadota bacterium]
MNDSTALAEAPIAAPEYERLPPRVWVLGGAMVLIGMVTFILMNIDGRTESYLYLAFYSIPSNTAISVFPHEPVLIWYGQFADMWLSAGSATVGTVIAGWLDHRVFVPVLNYSRIISYKKKRFYRKSTDIFMRYPFATLVVTGLTPIPFWPFKFLCFSIHYPLWRYLTALATGRFPRYVLLAWVGAEFGIPAWILILSVVVIFAVYSIKGIPAVWRRWQERRRAKRRADADVYRVSNGGSE